ncbi:HU family DNA-binding protein [Vibrio lentus]|nr:HU family DNA-binding protein [Vibrio lentus]
MALTKADLCRTCLRHSDTAKRDAKETVEVFFEEVRKALENGEQGKTVWFW